MMKKILITSFFDQNLQQNLIKETGIKSSGTLRSTLSIMDTHNSLDNIIYKAFIISYRKMGVIVVIIITIIIIIIIIVIIMVLLNAGLIQSSGKLLWILILLLLLLL